MSLLTPSPLKNKKTCFASGRVEWEWPLAQAGPPARPPVVRQPVVIGVESWLPSARFPPAVQARQAGGLGGAPVCRPQLNPLSQHGNNGLEGLEGAHQSSPVCPRLPPATGTGCCEVCFPSHLVFHLAGHIVSTTGQGKQWPQETSLGCCWGSGALEVAERRRDYRRTNIAQVPFCLGL